MANKNYYNREYRKDSFCMWAYRIIQYENTGWFTSHQLAKAFKMKASTHVRKMLIELIDEGILISKVEVHRVGKKGEVLATKRMYRLKHSVEQEYDKKNGKVQLL